MVVFGAATVRAADLLPIRSTEATPLVQGCHHLASTIQVTYTKERKKVKWKTRQKNIASFEHSCQINTELI